MKVDNTFNTVLRLPVFCVSIHWIYETADDDYCYYCYYYYGGDDSAADRNYESKPFIS